MKSFTKTVTTVYEPLQIIREFMEYDENFIRIRSRSEYKGDSCFKCDRHFQFGEMISLVTLNSVGNKTMCQSCADDFVSKR